MALLVQVIMGYTGKKPDGVPAEVRETYRQLTGHDHTVFSFTPSGSADKETFDEWLEMVRQHYVRAGKPVRNVDGERVVIKVDGGPAFNLDPAWLRARRAEGFVIFPGLPNGSALNQVGVHPSCRVLASCVDALLLS
jgi:hypothetical protein